jgi:hypothetical protein
MAFDEKTGQMSCVWDPAPPFGRKKFKRVMKEYQPWRNQIYEDWAKRHNTKVLIVEY